MVLSAVAGYVVVQYDTGRAGAPGCKVVSGKGDGATYEFTPEQAVNAATITAVGTARELPERAVTIALATALQESALRNIGHGDRDSLGLFQQRPSQGWGTPDKLRDPVQATSKFFDALVKISDYLDRDLHDAAQKVQRSADGTAYAQHEPDGKLLATAFTGREPATARCWFPPDKRTASRRPEALREMRRAFGGRLKVGGPGSLKAGAPSDPDSWNAVKPTSTREGWSVASWAVTHAQVYGLTEVRYAGKRWDADKGHDGWTEDKDAPEDSVIVR